MVKPPVKVESIDPELLELISEEHQAWRNALPVEELARYGGKYIATRKKQIGAASESLGELYRQLESMELRGRCLIEYMKNPTWWLSIDEVYQRVDRVYQAPGRQRLAAYPRHWRGGHHGLGDAPFSGGQRCRSVHGSLRPVSLTR
jgi:hypothetical protein